MVKLFEGTPNYYRMDGYLHKNLDYAREIIKDDWDMLFVVDGMEGSGKSVLAQQMATCCDPTLTVERVVFTPFEFRKAILNAKKYQAIIYDEAYTGLSSRATMSTINKALVSMLAEIRQKNLFVFVVMPTFFDLDKYVAIWRSRALIHVYTKKGFERGYFCFYSRDKKKDLYLKGKKLYSYGIPKANFYGNFPNKYTVDTAAYKAKKRKSLSDREAKAEEAEIVKKMEDALFRRCMELPQRVRDKVPNYILAKVIGISEVHFYRKVKQFNDNLELS